MKFLNKKINNENFISIIIFVFVFVDIINYCINLWSGLNDYNSVSVYFKGVVELYVIYYLLKQRKYNLYLWLIVLFIFSVVLNNIISVVLGNSKFSYQVIYILFKEANKFFFSVLLFLFILDVKPKWHVMNKIISLVYIASAFIVILGLIFNIDFLYTYEGSTRFGFKPLIAARNEVTLFWLIGCFYFLLYYFSRRDVKSLLSLILVVFAASVLGTKAVYLVIVPVFLLFILSLEKKIKYIILIVGVLLLAVNIYLSNILLFIQHFTEKENIIFAITSGRSKLFLDYVVPIIKKWDWYNYLIGGVGFYPVSEMDFVDLFIFSGLLGVFIYLFLVFKTIFNFSKKNYLGFIFVFLFLLIGGIAGHFFASGTNAIYIALLSYYIQNIYKDNVF